MLLRASQGLNAVHLVYGLLGLKTHSKIALVVRREGTTIRRYVHLATGNYNPVTAQLCTDLGYFTCDDEIGRDAIDLFNYLTGYSAKTDYRKLLVAPINLCHRLESLIQDLKSHGLLDQTIMVWASEMGRTPFDNNLTADKPGRDHNQYGLVVWMPGGGVRAGSTFGVTDDFSVRAAGEEIPLRDMHATLLHMMGLNQECLSFLHAGCYKKLTDIGGLGDSRDSVTHCPQKRSRVARYSGVPVQ